MALNELDQLEQAAIHLTPTGSDKNIPFEEQLQGLYPDLSGDEIKILTYVRMSMSTAEIARLKSITIAGVNKSRNRIRKKLGLQPSEDLREHLLKL
jgi:DNA-binding CsgD family transcriptional regulator